MRKPTPGRFVLFYQKKPQDPPFTPTADGITSPGRHLEGEELEKAKAFYEAREAERRKRELAV